MDNFYEYCKEGNLNEIKKLNLTLEDIRSLNNNALIWASFYGHLEVVKYLVNKGLTLEDIRSYDNNALIGASLYGHLEVVKFLIDKGLTIKDIRSKDNKALIWASHNGYLEVVKYLEEQIKILEAKEEHKKEWDYICGEIEYKPDVGIKYFEHLEEFIKTN